LRVLAIAQRCKHDLRAGRRRREDRVESGVASGTGNRLPPEVTRRKMSAPGRIPTRDPLLRRHLWIVAVGRPMSPYWVFSCNYCGWKSSGVAQSLSPLAPVWLPET
jgi:hypothetical protein